MPKLKQLLIALKLFDPDSTLSLTNVALMVIIVKIAATQTLDMTVITTFFLALINYNAKRFANYKHTKHSDAKVTEMVDDKQRLVNLEHSIKELTSKLSLKNLTR